MHTRVSRTANDRSEGSLLCPNSAVVRSCAYWLASCDRRNSYMDAVCVQETYVLWRRGHARSGAEAGALQRNGIPAGASDDGVSSDEDDDGDSEAPSSSSDDSDEEDEPRCPPLPVHVYTLKTCACSEDASGLECAQEAFLVHVLFLCLFCLVLEPSIIACTR